MVYFIWKHIFFKSKIHKWIDPSIQNLILGEGKMKMKTVVEMLTPIFVSLQHKTNQLLLLMSKFDYLSELYL